MMTSQDSPIRTCCAPMVLMSVLLCLMLFQVYCPRFRKVLQAGVFHEDPAHLGAGALGLP